MSGTLLIMTLMGHLTFCENKVLQSTGDKENKKDTIDNIDIVNRLKKIKTFLLELKSGL